LENLAFDLEYIKFLKCKGSVISFSMVIYIDSYLYSKERAYISFIKNRRRLYSYREEYCIAIFIMDKIC
ncbi:hypothetical protein DL98DRAFT_441682, partial [Cadophora sp. DSE1049]